MTDEFESVANGQRRRARWRCTHGWMRVERLSDHHLRIRGPRAELLALARAVSVDWNCMLPDRGLTAAGDSEDGLFELTLVRNPSPAGSGRCRRRTETLPLHQPAAALTG
jgi:hypothetical protein